MIEINNGILKTVSSLSQKRKRDETGLFVAEGWKCVRDTWGAFRCRYLICTRAWHDQHGTAEHHPFVVLANKRHMERLTQFSTSSDVLAVYEQPQREVVPERVRNALNIVLDNVQDPGNLGTIVRLADWFGINDIFCSKGSVDVFNHKVVQATMGAIARVNVHYCDLEALLDEYHELPAVGTFLDSENIYNASLPEKGFIVLGNEGQGIGHKVAVKLTQRVTIPPMPHSTNGCSESLNVGTAAAIAISEFRRNALKAQ